MICHCLNLNRAKFCEKFEVELGPENTLITRKTFVSFKSMDNQLGLQPLLCPICLQLKDLPLSYLRLSNSQIFLAISADKFC